MTRKVPSIVDKLAQKGELQNVGSNLILIQPTSLLLILYVSILPKRTSAYFSLVKLLYINYCEYGLQFH